MSDSVQLAKRYFELSNDGKLADIKQLFTPSSTYSSENTGVYLGAEQIMEMQTSFFATFETMHWDVHSVEEVRPGVVLFDFIFSGTTLDGEQVHRPGKEYVIVYAGKLQHIEVRNKQ